MEHYTTSFNFWIEKKNYIPTARLSDWPTNWYSINNLRFFGSVSWVAAVPHDIESRVRLEALHESITKRTFFDPFVFEKSTDQNLSSRLIYVSLIPGDIVNWFSSYTLLEIHEQIALYIALLIIDAEYNNDNIIRDTHSSYHSIVKQHLQNICAEYPDLRQDNLPLGPHDIFERNIQKIDDYKEFYRQQWDIEKKWRVDRPLEAEAYDQKRENFFEAKESLINKLYSSNKMPDWFIKRTEWKSSNGDVHENISTNKVAHGYFLWERPTGALADDFGIVSYGLTFHDFLRIQGKKIEYDKDTGEKQIKKLSQKEFENAKIDDLNRSESDSAAFEFLLYAKTKNTGWPNWIIKSEDNTGYIYFISDDRAIKIGFTSQHPEHRLSVLQTGNPRRLKLIHCIKGSVEKEKLIHSKFSDKRLTGEWFDLSSDDVKSLS